MTSFKMENQTAKYISTFCSLTIEVLKINKVRTINSIYINPLLLST